MLTFVKDNFLIPGIKYFHAWSSLILIFPKNEMCCEANEV